MGVSVNTVRASVNRLITAGLIDVTTPEKPSMGVAGQSTYFLKIISNSGKIKKTVSISDTVPDTVVKTVSISDTVSDIFKSTVSNSDTSSDTASDTASDTNNKQNVNQTKQVVSMSKNENLDFSSFERIVKSKYPNVSALNQQLTMLEYESLIGEFKISRYELKDILQRMENFKPLQEKYTSVYYTMRTWLKKDALINYSDPSYKNGLNMATVIQSKLNEGPTIGSR